MYEGKPQGGDEAPRGYESQPDTPRHNRRRLLLGGAALVLGATGVGMTLDRQPAKQEQPLDIENRFPLDNIEAALKEGREYPLVLTEDRLDSLVEVAMLTKYKELGVAGVSVRAEHDAIESPEKDESEEEDSEILHFKTRVTVDLDASLLDEILSQAPEEIPADIISSSSTTSFTLTSDIISKEKQPPVPMHGEYKVPKVRADDVKPIGVIDAKTKEVIKKIGKRSGNDPSAVDPQKVAKTTMSSFDQSLKLIVQPLQERFEKDTIIVNGEVKDGELHLTFTTYKLLEEKAKAEAEIPPASIDPGEIETLSDTLAETVDFLVDSKMFEELGFSELLSADNLEKALEEQSLGRTKKRTEHGQEQVVSINIVEGEDIQNRVDVQFSKVTDREVIVASGVSFFLDSNMQLTPNPSVPRKETFTEEECREAIRKLSGDSSIDIEDFIIKDGYVTAVPQNNEWIIHYHVSPQNGHVKIFTSLG